MFAWQREDSPDPFLTPEINSMMLELVGYAVERSDGADKPLSIGGEMAGDPAALPALLHAGVRALSVTPSMLPGVSQQIGSVTVKRTVAMPPRCV